MSSGINVEELHENEVKILLALKDLKRASAEEIARITGLTRDAVERASDWATTKGLLSVEEKVSETLVLSEEGREYAEQDLPERRLLNLIEENGIPISELKEALQRSDIALNWALRNGWARIERGTLLITEAGKAAVGTENLDEKILRSLREAPSATLPEEWSERMEVLLRRGLVRRMRRSEKMISLTTTGETILPLLGSRGAVGLVTQLTPDLLRSGQWRGANFQRYDVTLPVPSIYPGKRHFVQQVIDYIRRIWLDLGFKEMKGPILDSCFWVFDALYQPQDHPARDLADTFYMKVPREGRLPDSEIVEAVKATHENGWTTGSTGWRYSWDPAVARRCCLRTHTTSLSARTLAELRDAELPAKFFSVGRVFRNETIDWKHLAEFHHTDGIVVGEGVTFRHLLGYLKNYLDKMGVEKARFRPSYFPYTEMSCEAEIWNPEKEEWMELFGAGMFRPEVVKPLLGRDVPVLAWGPGFERIVMSQYSIKNMRDLYFNDLAQIREAKLWVR
jgi:phenylalanyl-tRNA synthetase alpha chain